MVLQYLILIFACLLLGLVVSHAAITHPSEIYWENVLPNTPMPKAVRDRLSPDHEGKPVTVKLQNTGPNRSNLYQKKKKNTEPNRSNLYNKKKNTEPNRSNLYNKNTEPNQSNLYNKNTEPNRSNLYNKNTGPNRTNLYNKNTGPNRSNLYNVARSNLYDAAVATSGTQLQDDPNASLFFLEKNLHPGTKMNLHFIKSTAASNGAATFLPQKLAKEIPFSSKKLPEILIRFSINPKSEEAEVIKETIEDCEEPAIANEEKYCATSLESMIGFGTSKLGKNVNVFTTEIVDDKAEKTQTTSKKLQQYVITSGVKKMVAGDDDNSVVVCHSMTYVYAIFYCHATHTARAYVVPLVGANGTKIKAVAVCHQDTSAWNPNHLAFQVLKVKPGTVPICHFLTEDNIVWAAN